MPAEKPLTADDIKPGVRVRGPGGNVFRIVRVVSGTVAMALEDASPEWERGAAQMIEPLFSGVPRYTVVADPDEPLHRLRDGTTGTTLEALAEAQREVENLEREKAALHDCGQDGVCALAPGCVRHFAEQAQKLIADKDELAANFAAVEAAAARYNEAGDAIDKDKQGQIDRLLSCADMFDDAVKAGDLGSDGSRDAVAMRAGAMALTAGGRCSFCGWVPEMPPQKDDSVMQAHIRACEKHPLAAAEKQRDALAAGLADALEALADMSGFVETAHYAEKYGIAETMARLRKLLPESTHPSGNGVASVAPPLAVALKEALDGWVDANFWSEEILDRSTRDARDAIIARLRRLLPESAVAPEEHGRNKEAAAAARGGK